MKDELKNKLIKNGLYQKDALERIIEDKNFTIEDKLFANRLAFLVFKKYGLKANFSKHFLKKIKSL